MLGVVDDTSPSMSESSRKEDTDMGFSELYFRPSPGRKYVSTASATRKVWDTSCLLSYLPVNGTFLVHFYKIRGLNPDWYL